MRFTVFSQFASEWHKVSILPIQSLWGGFEIQSWNSETGGIFKSPNLFNKAKLGHEACANISSDTADTHSGSSFYNYLTVEQWITFVWGVEICPSLSLQTLEMKPFLLSSYLRDGGRTSYENRSQNTPKSADSPSTRIMLLALLVFELHDVL